MTQQHHLVVQKNITISENPLYHLLGLAQGHDHPVLAPAPSPDPVPHPDPCLVLPHVRQETAPLDDTETNAELRHPMTEINLQSAHPDSARKRSVSIGSHQLVHLIGRIVTRIGIGTRVIVEERDIARHLVTEHGRRSEVLEVGQCHHTRPQVAVAAVGLLKRTGAVCIDCLGL